MRRVALLGTGGHARAVWDIIDGTELECYVTLAVSESSPDWLPVPVRERHVHDSIYSAALIDILREHHITDVILGIGGDDPIKLIARQDLLVRLGLARLGLPYLVARASHTSAHVNGEKSGAQVMPGAVIRHSARIERGAIINSGAIVEHDAWIGAGAHVAPGAVVLGGARVCACAMVGAGAVVLPHTIVPPETLVRALSVFGGG